MITQGRRSTTLDDSSFKVGPVVKEPVQVEEPLVDDVLVDRAFVLEDDGATVLVEPQGVDTPAVLLAG